MADLMEKIVSLCKRRGFVYPACEIYGGFANAYSYGPYGVELKNNIKKLWWKTFVQQREDIVGLDGPILLHPRVWEASGHIAGFNDSLVDCRSCQRRWRADHLVEEATHQDLEGEIAALDTALTKIKCPNCGQSAWTKVRKFNLMFKTQINNVSDEKETDVYLRPETAGAIFVEYQNVLDSQRVKIPFGIAQIGKAFRNEIVAGNFIFRLREFEQMEIEYFIHPRENWEKLFNVWLNQQESFAISLGAGKKDLRRAEHSPEKLSHYSRKTVDLEYKFPFGFRELYGLAHRGDFDLASHGKVSGRSLDYFDQEKNERYIPHVLEPTFGLDRSLLVALLSAYHEEKVKGETRVVMKFPQALAPIQLAILPLSKKAELTIVARDIFQQLKTNFVCEYDETQSIGKRYRRQDEIGTPYCLTVDFDSLTDKAVTIRERDTMAQERVQIGSLDKILGSKFKI